MKSSQAKSLPTDIRFRRFRSVPIDLIFPQPASVVRGLSHAPHQPATDRLLHRHSQLIRGITRGDAHGAGAGSHADDQAGSGDGDCRTIGPPLRIRHTHGLAVHTKLHGLTGGNGDRTVRHPVTGDTVGRRRHRLAAQRVQCVTSGPGHGSFQLHTCLPRSGGLLRAAVVEDHAVGAGSQVGDFIPVHAGFRATVISGQLGHGDTRPCCVALRRGAVTGVYVGIQRVPAARL